ncbi:MAG TPA: hypothetical protein VFS00_34005 [Polyangiaceae bacterium]|nr:hypothetical protein [Polyangiaceae bacterium]
MTSIVALGALGALAAAPLACDDAGGNEFAPTPELRSCSARGCANRVRIELAAPLAPTARAPGPLAFRLCFDASCSDLALRGEAHALACEAVGEPAPDQIASCEARAGGAFAFEIVRLDDRRYEGSRAVVALSARDASGGLLFHDAAEVSLEPVYANGRACGVTCAQASVVFAPDDTTGS